MAHQSGSKHHDSLEILRDISHLIGRDSQIDRAYALREGAISAAKTDDWAQASAWFGEAEKAAATSEMRDMQTMAVGLEADRAVAILELGNVEDVPLTGLDRTVSKAIDILRSDQYIAPRQLWEVGLRLFEKIQQSSFRKSLAPLLVRWLKEQWKRIVARETFQLARPMHTVPAIEVSLAENKKDEAFIASLLLTTADAVGSPLSVEYEARLQEVASGDR
jgi:hypothetical protein